MPLLRLRLLNPSKNYLYERQGVLALQMNDSSDVMLLVKIRMVALYLFRNDFPSAMSMT